MYVVSLCGDGWKLGHLPIEHTMKSFSFVFHYVGEGFVFPSSRVIPQISLNRRSRLCFA